ncbi:MAG: acyltransferase family protein [Terracidiphilus sp.]
MAENAGKIAPFRSLDVLRGLAALWVVMCHAADHYVGGTRWEKWPVYSFSLRGQLGVVLFFLISGYCIIGAAYSAFASGKRVRRFAFERARRIYPPYFFTIVLALLVGGTLILAQHHHLILAIHHPMQLSGGARFWVSNLFIIQSEAGQGYINIDFWSLCDEVAFYVIVGVILLGAKWIERKWGAPAGLFFFSLVVVALTVESLLWQITSGSAGTFPMDRWYQFGLGGLFFLAAEIKSESFVGYSEMLRTTNRVMMAVAVILTAVFASTRSLGGGTVDHPSSRVQSWIAILYLALFWVLRSVEAQFTHRRALSPLFWLGSFSYSLYLVHPYFLGLVDLPARKMGLVGDLYLISWALQIIVGVIAGWIFYLVVERHFVSSRQKRRIATELGAEPS